MNDQKNFASALERAIAHSGVEILNGEPQLYSLVADFLGNNPQSKQSMNLLRSAIECGIPARMYGAVNKDAVTQNITVATCRKLLIDNYGFGEEATGRFMNEFSAALGWEVAVVAPSAPAVSVKKPAVQPKQTEKLSLVQLEGMSVEELLAADQNDPNVQNQLGHCYQFGKGVEENMEVALHWYRKAAEQGNGRACYALGDCYRRGTGVKKDDDEAVRWFRKSAELGDPFAPGVIKFMTGKPYVK